MKYFREAKKILLLHMEFERDRVKKWNVCLRNSICRKCVVNLVLTSLLSQLLYC